MHCIAWGVAGDLLLFQRGMPEDFSARSVYVFLSRLASGVPWDHVAVVVRDHDPKNDVPYVLEACAKGVQVPTCGLEGEREAGRQVSVQLTFCQSRICWHCACQKRSSEPSAPQFCIFVSSPFLSTVLSV